MKWELKTEMCKLKGADKKADFQKFVLEHIDKFDAQAFEMFAEIANIDIDEMANDIDFWTKIYEHLDCNMSGLSLRSALRLSMLTVACEENLNIKPLNK